MLLLLACAPVRKLDPPEDTGPIPTCEVPAQTAWWIPEGGEPQDITDAFSHDGIDHGDALSLTTAGRLQLGAGDFTAALTLTGADIDVVGCGVGLTILHAAYGTDSTDSATLSLRDSRLTLSELTLRGDDHPTLFPLYALHSDVSLRDVAVTGWTQRLTVSDSALLLSDVDWRGSSSLWLHRSRGTLRRSTFAHNAPQEPVVSCSDSTLAVTGSAFVDNAASGAAIVEIDRCPTRIVETRFEANSAYEAAIVLHRGTIACIQSDFIDNTPADFADRNGPSDCPAPSP